MTARLAALAGLLALGLYGFSIQPRDTCRVSDDDVRAYWATSLTQSGDEAERVQIVQQLVEAQQNLCRHQLGAQTPALPADLQRRTP